MMPHLSEQYPQRRKAQPELHHVDAALTYVVDTGARPVIYSAALTGGPPQGTADYVQRRVHIDDARPIRGQLSLDRQGFELRRHASAVADFHDDEQVRKVYYPEVEDLLKQATGAEEVLIFDHTVRVDAGAEGESARKPVRNVHNDYTAGSGPQRIRDLLPPEKAKARLAGRFAVINVWRPIREPLLAAPLALADARSAAPADLVAIDLVYPDRTGEIYEVAFNPDHRWFYFPKMGRHEVVLIKSYDSAADGRARFTPHTAFDDPTTPADAPARASIEVRALVFFPTEDSP